jgi:hypothetical protein
MNIAGIYAPTNSNPEKAKDRFWKILKTFYTKYPAKVKYSSWGISTHEWENKEIVK